MVLMVSRHCTVAWPAQVASKLTRVQHSRPPMRSTQAVPSFARSSLLTHQTNPRRGEKKKKSSHLWGISPLFLELLSIFISVWDPSQKAISADAAQRRGAIKVSVLPATTTKADRIAALEAGLAVERIAGMALGWIGATITAFGVAGVRPLNTLPENSVPVVRSRIARSAAVCPAFGIS